MRSSCAARVKLAEEPSPDNPRGTRRSISTASVGATTRPVEDRPGRYTGALAIDERRGDQYGGAVDFETAAAAHEIALQECGSGCSVALTFGRCAAYAVDQDANSTAVGWYDSATGARQTALAECRSRGSGTGCIVRVCGCNGPVVEEGLSLNRAARRQVQRGLRAAGFDPRGADGQFGPRTRAAIRNWQSARAARGAGYLDGPATTALQSAATVRFQPAEAATAASPQSPSATAAQENLFWQSIVNSTDPADFEAYLKQFPNGLFRRLAQNRLCRRARQAPTASGVRGGMTANAVTAAGGGTAPAAAVPTRGRLIDFGDDTSEYARDNESDNMRSDGPGMASGLTLRNRGRDAADCRRLYREGRIYLFGVDLDSGYVDFRADASSCSRDGECDAPRFKGSGMDELPIRRDRAHDATDCRRLYNAGRIRLLGVNIRGVR